MNHRGTEHTEVAQRRACMPTFRAKPLSVLWFNYLSEVAAALFVPAVTVELDRAACAFTRCAAILATLLRRAGTSGILTRLSVIVCHEILLKDCRCFWGA